MLRFPQTALLGLTLVMAHAWAAEAASLGRPSPIPFRGSASRDLRRAAPERVKVTRAAKRHGRQGKMQGRVVSDSELRASALPAPSGDLHIYSINHDEVIKTNIYNPDGSFNVEAAKQIAHVFRCKRTGEEHEIDPRLLTILSHVNDHFGGRRIDLLSGYRFQRRTTSNHFHGTASYIRIPGVSVRGLRDFVHTLDAGGMGVGFYPRVGFIHVDVRPAPSYRWIDNSRSNPDSADKQPPRNWKRKKLES
jgi:uncharacterized protein YcbK (DUF882 family)